MTRPVLTILFFFSLLGSAQAQQLNHFWTKFIGGNHSDAAYDAIATPDGGIVFTGQTKSNGSGDIPLSSFGTDTFVNLIVGKIDTAKQLKWIKVYGGSKNDIGQRICATSDGGFAVLGMTSSGNGNVTGFRGVRDLWLLKLDAAGNLMWQKTFGSSNSGSIACDLIQTRDGGFMLMGTINGAGDDIPIHYSNSPFYQDWFILKTDANGNKQWAKTLGGDANEEPVGSIIEINDGYYLIGSSESRDHECIDTAWHPGVNTKFDFYLLKLDPLGNVLWQRSYGGTQNEGPVKGILDPRDSSVVFVGPAKSFDYIVPKTTIGSVTWVVKADKNGTLKWSKILGNSLYPQGDDIVRTSDGYMISTQTEDDDIGLYIIDSNGNKMSDRIIGGSDVETPYAIVLHNNRGAVIGATLSDEFPTGSNLNTAPGPEDIFIAGLAYWPVSVSMVDSERRTLIITPNPSSEAIIIAFPSDSRQKGRLAVFDSKGTEVYKRKTRQNTASITIETGQWPPGVYIVQWQDEDGQTANAKFIHN